jgi:hypothetical protein
MVTNVSRLMDADNDVERFQPAPAGVRLTEAYKATEAVSRMMPTTPSVTEASGRVGVRNILSAKVETVSQHTIAPTVQARKINGVIGEIMDGSVIVYCQNGSQEIPIRLPTSIIPEDLLHHGEPVSVFLDQAKGYRIPVIEKRAISTLPKLPDENAINEWIKSI